MADAGPTVLPMGDNGEALEITSRFLSARGIEVAPVAGQKPLHDRLDGEAFDVAEGKVRAI